MKGRMVLDTVDRSIIKRKIRIKGYIIKRLLNVYLKYLELVHMAEVHSQAHASSPYELVPNILRYTFNNLYILHGVKEHSVILHESKEGRSRQNYFCPVIAMKEESGSHFPLQFE